MAEGPNEASSSAAWLLSTGLPGGKSGQLRRELLGKDRLTRRFEFGSRPPTRLENTFLLMKGLNNCKLDLTRPFHQEVAPLVTDSMVTCTKSLVASLNRRSDMP